VASRQAQAQDSDQDAPANLRLDSAKALYNLVSRVCGTGRTRRKCRFTRADLDKLAKGENPWPEARKGKRKGVR
jgi:hypothetical protein